MTPSLPPRDESADPLLRVYAPPAVDEPAPSSPRARWSAPSAYVFIYVALQLAALGCDLATVIGPARLFPLSLAARALAAVIGLAWLHEQWTRLPPRWQVIDGDRISAGAVVGRHVVPVFGLFWLFKVPAALCGALDLRLAEKGRPTGAPRALGIAAAAGWLVGRLAFMISNTVGILCSLAAAVLWAAYMVAIERTFARAFRRRGARQRGEA